MSDESDRKVWLLVNDIDATYLDTPEQQAFVSTFFSACRSIVREVNNLFIRAVVRTDVWTNLRKNEDLDKAEQYVTDISWSELELKIVLSKKIYAYMYRNYPTEVERLHLNYDTDADRILVLRSIQLIQLYRTVESIEGKRHLSPGAVAAGFGMLSHILQVPSAESSDWI